ncbi:MAG TPA: response regulator transcription factor [Chitinophagaceae bacterium]
MKILVIEDEQGMRESMVTSLQQEKYVVESAVDFNTAREKLEVYQYDCILLDIGLPGGNGLVLLEELKKQNNTEGVIIVSARDSLEDKIKGLNLGADDYLAKPFHLAELSARVKSVLRRKRMEGSNYITCDNLKIDAEQRMVWINEEELTLNRKEYDVLLYLAINKNRLVNKAALAEHVWGDYIDDANSFDFIYSQIKNLRKKLKDNDAGIEIQAVYGVGYKLVS